MHCYISNWEKKKKKKLLNQKSKIKKKLQLFKGKLISHHLWYIRWKPIMSLSKIIFCKIVIIFLMAGSSGTEKNFLQDFFVSLEMFFWVYVKNINEHRVGSSASRLYLLNNTHMITKQRYRSILDRQQLNPWKNRSVPEFCISRCNIKIV